MEKLNLLDRLCHNLSSPSCRVAIMMSGGGSNADRILSERNRYPNLEIVSLVTDQRDSNAKSLSDKHRVGLHVQNATKLSKTERTAYFIELGKYLKQARITTLLYAGFMKIVTTDFLQEFPGINSHPADLSVKDSTGKRKYVGMDVIQMALDDNAQTIRCSCCIVDNPVDSGQLISMSNPITIQESERANPLSLHNRLKQEAEWLYYPRTIEKLSKKELTINNVPYIFTEKDYV